jgi:hypothetical protein
MTLVAGKWVLLYELLIIVVVRPDEARYTREIKSGIVMVKAASTTTRLPSPAK